MNGGKLIFDVHKPNSNQFWGHFNLKMFRRVRPDLICNLFQESDNITSIHSEKKKRNLG